MTLLNLSGHKSSERDRRSHCMSSENVNPVCLFEDGTGLQRDMSVGSGEGCLPYVVFW